MGLARAGLDLSSSFIRVLWLPGIVAGELGHRCPQCHHPQRCSPAADPGAALPLAASFAPNLPSHQVHRVMMNKAQGIPLIPALPSWVKPMPSGGTETKAMPLMPVSHVISVHNLDPRSGGAAPQQGLHCPASAVHHRCPRRR